MASWRPMTVIHPWKARVWICSCGEFGYYNPSQKEHRDASCHSYHRTIEAANKHCVRLNRKGNVTP